MCQAYEGEAKLERWLEEGWCKKCKSYDCDCKLVYGRESKNE